MGNDVVVIGAGVIGASCALRLQRSGRQVVLVDRKDPGDRCSAGNAGLIGPNAIVPTALPGMLTKIPSLLLRREGPLSIRWRDASLVLGWFARWTACANAAQAHRSAAALSALNAGVVAGYRDLLGQAHFDSLVREEPLLNVSQHPFSGAASDLVAELRRRHAVRFDVLDAAGIADQQPGLDPRYSHGTLIRGTAYVRDPRRLVETLCREFGASGGTFLRDEVLGLDSGDGQAVYLRSSAKRHSADAVVIAAGAESVSLLGPLGLAVPMVAERGYHVMLEGVEQPPAMPVLDVDQKIVVTPMESGVRVTGFAEFGAPDAPADPRKWRLLEAMARRLAPHLGGRVSSRWLGARPSTPDSVPVIGRAPGLGTVVLAVGHGHYGMSGAPGTSQLVTDLVDGGRTSIDPEPYALTRFFPRRPRGI
jgi:D-amino-acid dehydrogenase